MYNPVHTFLFFLKRQDKPRRRTNHTMWPELGILVTEIGWGPKPAHQVARQHCKLLAISRLSWHPDAVFTIEVFNTCQMPFWLSKKFSSSFFSLFWAIHKMSSAKSPPVIVKASPKLLVLPKLPVMKLRSSGERTPRFCGATR